jgi:hypothetical protein
MLEHEQIFKDLVRDLTKDNPDKTKAEIEEYALVFMAKAIDIEMKRRDKYPVPFLFPLVESPFKKDVEEIFKNIKK